MSHLRPRRAQEGVMLLEALVGLLIFSLGILALVAMQSVSVTQVSNAKYRVEAAFLADEIINRIWIDSFGGGVPLGNVQTYVYPGGTSAHLANWVAKLQAPGSGLPGSSTYPPSITVTPLPIAGPNAPAAVEVQVIVRWKAPEALGPSNHIAIATISDPQ